METDTGYKIVQHNSARGNSLTGSLASMTTRNILNAEMANKAVTADEGLSPVMCV